MKKKLLALVVALTTLAFSAVLLAGCSGGSEQAADSGNGADAQGDTFTLGFDPVYYTHQTQTTKRIVYISLVAVSLKKII